MSISEAEKKVIKGFGDQLEQLVTEMERENSGRLSPVIQLLKQLIQDMRRG